VSGKGSGRVSIAALVAYRPRQRAHRYYRIAVRRGRRGERRSLSENDYAVLSSAAHQRLHAPIITFWDSLSTHVSKRLRAFLGARTDWLTVVRPPAYAPEPNPTGGIWSLTKRALDDALITSVDDLTHAVRTRLEHLQYHPGLLTGGPNQIGPPSPAPFSC
jgi:hypothetical protein